MNERLKRWLIKANSDFRTLEELINTDNELVTDSICFHSQQGIEKILKCFLISHGTEFSATHNLNLLRKLCADNDSDFSQIDISIFGPYAVRIRYGDEFFMPSDKEALEAYKIAVEIKKFVLHKLNLTEADLKL